MSFGGLCRGVLVCLLRFTKGMDISWGFTAGYRGVVGVSYTLNHLAVSVHICLLNNDVTAPSQNPTDESILSLVLVAKKNASETDFTSSVQRGASIQEAGGARFPLLMTISDPVVTPLFHR